MKDILLTFNKKNKIKRCLFVREAAIPAAPRFNTPSRCIKYLKSAFNSRNYIKIFRKNKRKLRVEKNNFD